MERSCVQHFHLRQRMTLLQSHILHRNPLRLSQVRLPFLLQLLFWLLFVRVVGIWFIGHEEFSEGLLAVGGGLVDARLKMQW